MPVRFQAVSIVVVLLGGAAAGQEPRSAIVRAAAAESWRVARLPWGDPDLQGFWPSRNLADISFQRITSFEPDAVRAELVEAGLAEPMRLGTRPETIRAEVASWLDLKTDFLSMVVDPPNGRLPPLTAAGERRAATAWRSSWVGGPWNSAADLDPFDRCITRGVLGSVFPSVDTSGVQIIQAPGTVAIRYEVIHETRIIPLDGRGHVGPGVRSYMGDPRGRWDGDTLVVETTNFNGRIGARLNGTVNPTSERLRVAERFTRVSATTVRYQVTVDDADTWVKPWTAVFALRQEPMYQFTEYACHEGNVAVPHILSGARAADARSR